ncbi:MAG: hypothetical protein ABJJ37_19115, partial [Roseibium sp.]
LRSLAGFPPFTEARLAKLLKKLRARPEKFSSALKIGTICIVSACLAVLNGVQKLNFLSRDQKSCFILFQDFSKEQVLSRLL